MKKSKYIILLISAAFLVFTKASAENDLSLSEAISIGLKNNYDLIIMKNNEKESKINNTWANTSIIPTLAFSAIGREAYNQNEDEDYAALTLTPQLTLNWTLFDGFNAQISKKRYEELQKQSEGNTALLIETTVQDIILGYYNCLVQKEMTKVYKYISDLSKDRMERAQTSKDIGASTSYEFLQYKTSYLEDYSNYLKQKTTYENAIRELNYIIANKENKIWNLTTKLTTDTQEYKFTDLQSQMNANNQNLKNLYISQEILRLRTKSARSDYFPSIGLSAGITNTENDRNYKGDTKDINSNNTDYYAGLTLSWTIFNGGTRKRAIQIAKIEEQSGNVEIEQMNHSLNNRLMQMLSTYNVDKSVYGLSKEQLETAKLNLKISKEKYESGAINSFNYRDVQKTYLNAAASGLAAVYNLIEANTDLLIITGGIISYKDSLK